MFKIYKEEEMNRAKVTARVLTMILIITLSAASAVYAAEPETQGEEALISDVLLPEGEFNHDGQIQPRVSGFMCTMAFDQDSSTRATARVIGTVAGTVDRISSNIALQVYSGGKYVNSGASSANKTVYNTNYISHGATFKISSGKKYRIKITLSAVDNGILTTSVFYRNMTPL